MRDPRKHPQFKDKTGMRFGRLVVIEFDGRKNGRTFWKCRCDCGIEKVFMNSVLAPAGKTRSCGCLRNERVREALSKHGMADTPEHCAWQRLRRRCYLKSCSDYPRYGGRGIVVCSRWLESFQNFFEDMGLRPGTKYEIDRIDNDGPYSPKNCRWATKKQQARNRRSNRLVTFRGETKCLAEWAEEVDIPYATIRARITNYGWSIDDALTLRVGGKRGI